MAETDGAPARADDGGAEQLVSASRRGDEVDALVGALLTASRALVGVSARSLAEIEETVTLTQFRTLVVLESRGPCRLNQLADRLGVSPSSALRTVDRLIRAGFVARAENDADRREVRISATAAGSALVQAVTRARRAEIATIVAAMPSERRLEVVAALHAFADAAGEPQAEQPVGLLGW
ncbi:MarR family winged helix-turn-helix transcriptional regulator [Cellulomonas sp. SG140]|uniref:MarR family winged helix-turn-helix transcriptional regulator n=1 Tax=Cellulomonas sp. SG140 TaxID=2976536 RepID=UPI0021E80621|nr:MarR family transcriptional regulator [Cellulomonas sp. SG140]